MPFWKKNKPQERVPLYDFKTQTISTIPASELAPGMVQVTVRRDDGTVEEGVWVENTALELNAYQHPQFSEEVRVYFQRLKASLDDVYPQSLEQWEDLFRRDRDWQSELRIWLHIARVYDSILAREAPPVEPARKLDIFRILLGCTMSPREQVLQVTEREALSLIDAEQVLAAFYAPQA
jgi:hypothetical protein